MNNNYPTAPTFGNANKEDATSTLPNFADAPFNVTFTPEMDEIIKNFKKQHTTPPWDELAKQFPQYTVADLRKRWQSKQQEWTHEEDERLRYAVNTFGNSPWSKVVDYVGGRTANACKNRWNKLQMREMNPIPSTSSSCAQDGKKDTCVVMRKRGKPGDGTIAVLVTRKDIAKLWHLRRPEAAKRLGVAEMILRKVCIQLGLPRWGTWEVRRDPIEDHPVIEHNVPQLEQTASEEEQTKLVEDLWTTPLLQKPETAEGVAVTSTEKSDEDRPNELGSEGAGSAMLCEEQSNKVEQCAMETLDDKHPGADAHCEDLTSIIENKYWSLYYDQLRGSSW
jgi:hypothetical protein